MVNNHIYVDIVFLLKMTQTRIWWNLVHITQNYQYNTPQNSANGLWNISKNSFDYL